MKLIVAFVPMGFLAPISNELEKRRIHGMSVSTVHGFGQEHDALHSDQQSYLGIERTKKIRIEIACHDEEVELILNTIYEVAHTGLRGNGKVFVLPILDALRLKTGERGETALGQQNWPQAGRQI